MTNFAALKQANATRWDNAKVTRRAEFVFAARRLVLAKARYQAVESKTGVPWYFIAVVHEREASQNWNTQLGQGDPLTRVSVHVPAGRGPFLTWEAGAVDAMVNCAPYAARNKDWSVGGLLTLLEGYNGLKYATAGRPSPYIWSGTDQYTVGKVLVDHGPIEDVYPFGPNKGKPVVDQQLGCAGLLMAMMAIDRTISLDGKMPTIDTPDVIKPEPVPQPAASFWATIFAAILAIFKRK